MVCPNHEIGYSNHMMGVVGDQSHSQTGMVPTKKMPHCLCRREFCLFTSQSKLVFCTQPKIKTHYSWSCVIHNDINFTYIVLPFKSLYKCLCNESPPPSPFWNKIIIMEGDSFSVVCLEKFMLGYIGDRWRNSTPLFSI